LGFHPVVILSVPYQESLDGGPYLLHVNDKPLWHSILAAVERFTVPSAAFVIVKNFTDGPIRVPLRFIVDYLPGTLFPVIFAGWFRSGPSGYISHVCIRCIGPVRQYSYLKVFGDDLLRQFQYLHGPRGR